MHDTNDNADNTSILAICLPNNIQNPNNRTKTLNKLKTDNSNSNNETVLITTTSIKSHTYKHTLIHAS